MNSIRNKLIWIGRIIQKRWFNNRCKEVLKTPPIQPCKNGVVILSMLRHVDMLMYLISIKSFYRYLAGGEIVILDDGTLTTSDMKILRHHVRPLQIVSIDKVKTNKCPKGGCWERLLLISDYVKDYYVIQLDADTVTSDDIPEVSNYISDNTSFALGTNEGQKIESMKDTCARVKHWPNNHVQVIAEKLFDKINDYDHKKYVRGSASFAGFGCNSFSRRDVEIFSRVMEKTIGSTWFNWGTEQLTSNYIISNSFPSCVLPYPKYADYYTPHDVPYDESCFLHFSGANRFKKGLYFRKAKRAIRRINSV